MKTISSFLRDSRLSAGYTTAQVERETRIKKEFVEAIEKEDWNSLPEFPVVVGFVKNIASFLGIDRVHAVALLKRDYPPQKVTLNPPSNIKEGFHWGPRMTFLLGVFAVFTLVFSYLFVQYISFTKNPTLIVDEPKEGMEVNKNPLIVSGKTDPEVSLRVNNQPVIVNEDGSFATELLVTPETREVTIRVEARSGKETTVKRNINPQLTE